MLTMRSVENKTHRLALDALLLAIALIFSYVEAIFPLTAFIPLPSFKLGLANVVIMLAVWTVSTADAAMISLVRVVVMGVLFGNPVSIWFSLGGAIFSLFMLITLKKFAREKFSFVGISVLSAAAHNVGQITFATAFFGVKTVFAYLPFLLVVSTVFGAICGALVNFIYPKIQRLRAKK